MHVLNPTITQWPIGGDDPSFFISCACGWFQDVPSPPHSPQLSYVWDPDPEAERLWIDHVKGLNARD